MMKNLIAILFLPLFATGCKNVASNDEPSPPANAEAVLRISSDFKTDKTHYKPGETVILQLENLSDQDLGYNLCAAVLEQKKDEGWLELPSLWLCAAVLYSLEPGKSTTYPYGLGESLPAGEYRFVAEIHLMKSGMNGKRVSNIFFVEE